MSQNPSTTTTNGGILEKGGLKKYTPRAWGKWPRFNVTFVWCQDFRSGIYVDIRKIESGRKKYSSRNMTYTIVLHIIHRLPQLCEGKLEHFGSTNGLGIGYQSSWMTEYFRAEIERYHIVSNIPRIDQRTNDALRDRTLTIALFCYRNMPDSVAFMFAATSVI